MGTAGPLKTHTLVSQVLSHLCCWHGGLQTPVLTATSPVRPLLIMVLVVAVASASTETIPDSPLFSCSCPYEELASRGQNAHVDQGVYFYGKFKQSALRPGFWFEEQWETLPRVQRICCN